VVYTVVGATIGIPVLVDTDRQFCFQRHIALLRPGSLLTSEYLFLLLSTQSVFRDAWERTTGSAQPTLPLGGLRSIPVSAPPVAEQGQIVRRVESLFALVEKIEAGVAAATIRSDKMVQAILAKAFRGELVPTEAALAEQEGRDFETAEQLLERVRAARQTATPSRRKPIHRGAAKAVN
jgi:type I restriction enzyme, S subunit